jgi:hypothetical protein
MKKMFTLDFKDLPMNESHPNFAFFEAINQPGANKTFSIMANKDGVFLADGSFKPFTDQFDKPEDDENCKITITWEQPAPKIDQLI